jgi:hypothetical protein
MQLSPNQRHELLMVDRTHDDGWVTAVVENLLEVNPTIMLLELEH